jgi:SH3-like domain-containing protein
MTRLRPLSVYSYLAGIVLLCTAATANAFDFKTVGAAPVILYDAPSLKGGKLFVAPRGMPVEIVLTYGEWVKVRDVNGELAWTEAKGLSVKRNVIVKAAGAKLRASADDNAPVLMTADKGLLLELVDPLVSTAVKVRHKDGIVGYLKPSEVWGI